MIDRGESVRKLALAAMRVSGLATLAGRVIGGVGAILMLHRVTRAPTSPLGVNSHLTVRPDFLDALLGEVRRSGHRFVSMDEAVDRLKSGRRDEFFVAISADDAYRDNITEALPVLESHDAPITIHAAPGLVDGAVDLWWDVLEAIVVQSSRIVIPRASGPLSIDCASAEAKVAANCRIHAWLTEEITEAEQAEALRRLAREAGVDPSAPSRDTLMGWDELRAAARHPLVTIGAHTVHHYNLRRLDEATAFAELKGAADIVERELGMRPRHMAFPYGYARAVGPREVRLAREAGFDSAVTTRHGLIRPAHAGHLHALPRISVNGRYQKVEHIRTMLTGVTTPFANAGRLTVTV